MHLRSNKVTQPILHRYTTDRFSRLHSRKILPLKGKSFLIPVGITPRTRKKEKLHVHPEEGIVLEGMQGEDSC